jgi:hypothetical protein
MSVKMGRFVSLYLTAMTLSLTCSPLLEMPRKLPYGPDLYRAVQHTLYFYFALVGAPAEVGAVLSLGVLCFLVRHRKRSFTLTLIATICRAAGRAVWFALVLPAHREMARWRTLPLPENGRETRRQGEFGHATAVLDLIASILFETPGERRETRKGSANG